MKKILTTLFVCIPAFAMNSQNDLSLENLNTRVVNIEDIMYDKTTTESEVQKTTQGLETIVLGTKDTNGTRNNDGLTSKVSDLSNIMYDQIAANNNVTKKGLETIVLGTKDTDGSRKNDGLTSKVSDLEKFKTSINNIMDDKTEGNTITKGLETIVLGTKDTNGSRKNDGLETIVLGTKDTNGSRKDDGLTSKVSNLSNIMYDQIDANNNVTKKGLETTVLGTKKDNGGRKDDGLTSKVSNLSNIMYDQIDANNNVTKKGLETTVFGTKDTNGSDGLVSRVSDLEEFKKNTYQTDVSLIQETVFGKTDKDNNILEAGLVSKVSDLSNTINGTKRMVAGKEETTDGLVTIFSELNTSVTNLNVTVSTLEEKFNNKLEETWRIFVEEKYQKYMNEKKQVQDIILSCKANGTPVPTYIMETAEQLQASDLNTRRSVLSNILGKLNIFASLLDGEKIESIQNYLNITNVSQPQIQQVGPIMPGVEIVGSYIRVSGATREFTRSAGFRTGLPKQNWMDPNYDYFPCGSRPGIERKINEENNKRQSLNAEIEQANALALAKYQINIQTANGVAFPSGDFRSIVTDYNLKLTHHDI